MCVITINKDKKLEKSDIRKIWEHNPNGAGIVYYDKDGKATYIKGIMKLKRFFEIYEKIDTPHICHFRLASVGEVVPELTHPFPVYGKNKLQGSSKLLLVHNGHIGNYEILYHFLQSKGVHFDKNISDTYVLAKALSRLPADKIDDFIKKVGGFSKIVLVYPGFKIKTFGNFQERNGIRYSNLYWDYGYGMFSYNRELGFHTYTSHTNR